MKVGEIPQPYFVLPYENHEKRKADTIHLIKNAEGRSVDDAWTKVSMTDLGVNARRAYYDTDLEKDFNPMFEKFNEWMNDKIGAPHWQRTTHDLWYMEYEQGDWVKWHTHPLSTYSAVYFLHMPEPKDAISFRTFDKQHYIPKVKEGDIIFFNSMIPHSTICTSELGKISINFNIKAGFDDKYAESVRTQLEIVDKGEDATVEVI